MSNPMGVIRNATQPRHQTSGQYLNKNGSSAKQIQTAASVGFRDTMHEDPNDHEQDDFEDSEIEEAEAQTEVADGRNVVTLLPTLGEGAAGYPNSDYDPIGKLLQTVVNAVKKMEKGAKGLDKQGGALPNVDKHALQMADFVTLPKGVTGTNCSNCRFVGTDSEGHVCHNDHIKGQKVTPHNCCAYWDSDGTLRTWQHGVTDNAQEATDETTIGVQDATVNSATVQEDPQEPFSQLVENSSDEETVLEDEGSINAFIQDGVLNCGGKGLGDSGSLSHRRGKTS